MGFARCSGFQGAIRELDVGILQMGTMLERVSLTQMVKYADLSEDKKNEPVDLQIGKELTSHAPC
jgi:hypothetical protein